MNVKKILKVLLFVIISYVGVQILIIIGSMTMGSMGSSRSYTDNYKAGNGLTSFDSVGGPAPSMALNNGLSAGDSKSTGSYSTGESGQTTGSRLVVKSGTMSLVVKNVAQTIDDIAKYAEANNGWVVSSNSGEQASVPVGSITVRVPSESFDATVEQFKAMAARVSYISTQGTDVTEEYTDDQSRLRNLEATETQLLQIMEKSGTIPDVLQAQQQLSSVRGEIELTKGRIQYLEGNAKMATISVNLSLSEELLPIPPSEKWRPDYVLKQAWKSVLGTAKDISYAVIWIGVYALIWIPLLLIVFGVRAYIRKRKGE